MNKAIQVLIDRGFVKACTDIDALSDLMDKEPVTFYLGTDPTGRSLHIGHMVPFFAMHHLQENGHNPIALVGNGTAMIGDPSGRLSFARCFLRNRSWTTASTSRSSCRQWWISLRIQSREWERHR